MPKPPPIEYFMLRAPTPKEMLGEAVAALTKLGLNEVHFDLMTDVPAFAKNAKTTHDIKAVDFLTPTGSRTIRPSTRKKSAPHSRRTGARCTLAITRSRF